MTSILDLTRDLDPTVAEPYLRATGWELAHQGKLGNRWSLDDSRGRRTVAVPVPRLDEEGRSLMFVDVLQTLAEIEQRSVEAVARDLVEASSDLMEFRVIGSDFHHGEMPLRAAPELTKGAYGALQAAARAEVARRAHYAQGALPVSVRSFLEHAALTGTARGSVVMRVRPPHPPEPQQPILDGAEEFVPFERRVTMRLVEAVKAAKAATHADLVDIDALDDEIDEGLNANLCDALLDLSGVSAGYDAHVALRIRWALTRPVGEATTEVEITRAELARLPEVAAVLKQIDPQPNTLVKGLVTRVKRQPGDDVGSIWILAELEGKVRSVKIDLDRVDYERALLAHGSDLEVRAVGTLERAGLVRELVDPTAFEIVRATGE